METKFLGRTRSIAAASFIGLGTFGLYQNLDSAAGQLTHLFGNSANSLGTLPTIVLAVLRLLQAYVADRHHFSEALLQHALIMFWPLLLVLVGTLLSWDTPHDDANAVEKKDCGIVDLTARRSTLP